MSFDGEENGEFAELLLLGDPEARAVGQFGRAAHVALQQAGLGCGGLHSARLVAHSARLAKGQPAVQQSTVVHELVPVHVSENRARNDLFFYFCFF